MKQPATASSPVYLEIGQSSLKLLDGVIGLELPIERQPNGRLTDSCRARLVADLKRTLEPRLQAVPISERLKPGRQTHAPRAVCAINARGVSLRNLTIPATTGENFEQLLLLQIENEFPISPDELAWGCYRPPQQRGTLEPQELTVVAIKKDVIEEYSGILAEAGLNPVFTLGILASAFLCPQMPGSFAVLDIGRTHSELIWFCNGAPTNLRILAWGGDDITRAIQETLQITREEAEALKSSDPGPTVQRAIATALESVAPLIKSNGAPQKLYLAGKSARLAGIAPRFSEVLGGWDCQPLDLPAGEARSAAIVALQRRDEMSEGPPLLLQLRKPDGARETAAGSMPLKWAAIAVVLLLGLISTRYAEAVLKKPGLSAKLAEIQAAREKIPGIERETRFIQFLDRSQPRYLEAIAMIAEASGSGARFEALTMNRRGEVSLRGSMRNSQHATEFRSKLLESGKFLSVVIEEQTPTPDRQKVIVRISARFKPTR